MDSARPCFASARRSTAASWYLGREPEHRFPHRDRRQFHHLLRFFPSTAPSPMVPGVSGFPGANQAAANDSLQMTLKYRPATHNSLDPVAAECRGAPSWKSATFTASTSGLTTASRSTRSRLHEERQSFARLSTSWPRRSRPDRRSPSAVPGIDPGWKHRLCRAQCQLHGLGAGSIQRQRPANQYADPVQQHPDFLRYWGLQRRWQHIFWDLLPFHGCRPLQLRRRLCLPKTRDWKGLSLTVNFNVFPCPRQRRRQPGHRALRRHATPTTSITPGTTCSSIQICLHCHERLQPAFGKGPAPLTTSSRVVDFADFQLVQRTAVARRRRPGLLGAGAVLAQPVIGNDPISNVPGNTTTGVATAGNPATGGSGVNLFADPNGAFAAFPTCAVEQGHQGQQLRAARPEPREEPGYEHCPYLQDPGKRRVPVCRRDLQHVQPRSVRRSGQHEPDIAAEFRRDHRPAKR